MAGSAPVGDGNPGWGPDGDGTSVPRPPPRLPVPPLPRYISGVARPPRPAGTTSAFKKRRSTFVAPTRPATHRPGGVPHRPILDAGVHPGDIRPRLVPDAAHAHGSLLHRQLFQSTPLGPRMTAPMCHQAPVASSRKAQTPSFSEPAHLPSRQVEETSMEVAATASDTRRTTSTTSLQEDGDYSTSSSMPLYHWTPTPTPHNTMQQPMDNSWSYLDMMTQESEPEVEFLTQQPIPDIGSIKGRKGNYNHNEDIQLCLSWMAITYDPRVGNDQPRGTYWSRIAQHYHENKTFESDRNANSLEKRWNGIQKECIRFQECLEKIERLRPSGVPHTEYINLAQKAYDEVKGFPYIHCFMEVRHTEKFQTVYEAMKQAQGKGRSKSTAPSQEAQEDDRQPSMRPPGRKQSKLKQKRNDVEDEYAVHLATFVQMKAEEQKKREERWRAEKELEERKLLWDQEQKIMFCDTSNMDDDQKAYINAMRQQIVKTKEALVKASGGCSTSEQGSGGDADEAESLM